MNYSKASRFFPNECYICKSRANLKRCKCSMISYCGEDHRLQHLPDHEKFCKILMGVLKTENFSLPFEWIPRCKSISEKIEKQLQRSLNELELAIIFRLRVCFKCFKYKYVKLNNCPGCPVVSFCKNHPNDKIHDENCAVMVRYLNLLSIADELNVDLQCFPLSFPFITDKEKQMGHIDYLTTTLNLNGVATDSLKSRLWKINLLDFIDIASKLHIAIRKIHDWVPSEIIIHIDGFCCNHEFIKKKYWEFLLHLNSGINTLKIVITGSEDFYDSKRKISLCEKCISAGKIMSVEVHLMPYKEYMMQEDYQKPDVLFYCKFEDVKNSERTNNWSQVDCPIVLLIDSKLNFCETQYFLSSLTSKFQTIHEGQIRTPFSDISSSEDTNYLIILKLKAIETLSKSRVDDSSCEELVDIEIEPNGIKSSTSQDVDSTKEVQDKEQNRDVISASSSLSSSIILLESEGNCSKSTEKMDEKSKADNNSISESKNDESKLKGFENEENYDFSTKTIDEKLEPEKNGIHSVQQDDDNKIENTDQNPENVKSLSPASSVSSFIIIAEPGCDDLNSKNVNPEKSYFSKENHEEEADKPTQGTYLEKYIAFIKNENDKLRGELNSSNEKNRKLLKETAELQELRSNADEVEMLREENKNLHEHLNLSVGEITKLEKRNLELEERNLELQDICSKLIENNELMKETFIDNDELKKRFGYSVLKNH